MTGHDIEAIHEHLKGEPCAVVLLYQSHCRLTNSTLPYMEQIAQEYDLTLVRLLCDHLTAELAGTALPSLSVYRYGSQVSPPLRGARRRDVLIEYLKQHGVIE